MWFALLLIACSGGPGGGGPNAEDGVNVLGNSSHTSDGFHREVVATAAEGLATPRDLEFNPEADGELWVVNRADDSVTILFDAGETSQSHEHIVDPYALHFMEEVSSISFGAPGTFGTCQESRNTYNDMAAPNDFMGPTLWSSDLEIFGQSNPEAVDYLTNLWGQYADLGSHLDMLHESPLCMGIAWDHDNVFWVFDGSNQSIARYDFATDHGPGYDDHGDGIIQKFVLGEVSRVADVPSHMVFDQETGLLYVADTGNGRVAVLDTATGTEGDRLPSTEPGVSHHEMVGADFTTLIDGAEHGIEHPSGLALHDGTLFVGDNATGTIYAFDLEGEVLDWAPIPVADGGLMGIEVVSEDELWVVDGVNDEVLRLTSK